MSTAISTTPTSFENILDELEHLTRAHLLVYRLQVGQVFLNHFWQGDPAAFSHRAAGHDQRFELFFNKCGDTLTRYGLSQRMARDSVRAYIVTRTLPEEMVNSLFLSQVLMLGRIYDRTQRIALARAAIAGDWSMRTLRQAVAAVRAGLPFEEVTAVPTQAADALGPEPAKPLSPGRLVTRAEKLSNQVRDWAAQWAQADATQLRPSQRERLNDAVTDLEAQLASLRQQLNNAKMG